eukprot:COSAG05_NODE_11695_length_501_cov_0.691542_1_plen_53_part_01
MPRPEGGAQQGGGLAESKAIKAKLKSFGLSTKGSRSELTARLSEATAGATPSA